MDKMRMEGEDGQDQDGGRRLTRSGWREKMRVEGGDEGGGRR